MRKARIKNFLILVCVIVITVLVNITYKKQYIKTVAGKKNYDYVLSASQLDMKLGSIFSVYATGNEAPKVQWFSSDQNVAIINRFGQVITKNVGQTIITAKYKKECKDVIVNVSKSAKQDVLIYKDSTTVPAATEALNKININTFILTLSKNKYKYDGKKKCPKVTITSADNSKLILNKDYTIKYQHNKKAGTAQVVVTGIGDFTGSLVGTFIIEKASEDLTIPQINDTGNTTNSNSSAQSNSSSSTASRTSNVTSSTTLTPTSLENSKASSTRSKTYTSSSATSNKKTTTSSSSSTSSSKKQTSKSSSTSETTKNSFTTSKNSTSKNSFTKSPSSSTSKKNSSSSSNTSSNESPSDTNSSDSNTSSDTSSTNSSTSGQSSTGSTNQSSQSTDSTTSTTTE